MFIDRLRTNNLTQTASEDEKEDIIRSPYKT